VQIKDSLNWTTQINQIIDKANPKHLSDTVTSYSENTPVEESVIIEGGRVITEKEEV